MKKLLLLGCVFALVIIVACDPKENNKPGHVIDPPAKSAKATIITEKDGHKELRIGGNRVLAIGTYAVLIDPVMFPDTESFRDVAKTLYDNGYNLARIWVITAFKDTDLSPWVKENGIYHLDRLSPTFMSRMDSIAKIFTSEGVNIAWVLEDCWSIREGESFHPMNPNKTYDPFYPKLMKENAWGTNYWGERQHWIFKCHCTGTNNCDKCRDDSEIGGRKSPAKMKLFTEVANIAKTYGNIIYINSELTAYPEDIDWYAEAASAYTNMVANHIRDTYPGCIIGTSVMDGFYNAYKYVHIADLHGLGCDNCCDVRNIESLANMIRRINPNIVICMNNDGCMSGITNQSGARINRYDKDITVECGRLAWQFGSFYEVKGDNPANRTWWPVAPGLLEGGKELRKLTL